MAWTGTAATGTMAIPSSRSPQLACLVLAGTVMLLPWTIGGRSPTGQALAVLLPILAVAPLWLAAGPRLRPATASLLIGAAVLAAGSAAQTIYPDRTIQSLLLLLAYSAAGSAAAHCAQSLPWARPVLLGAIVLSNLAAGLAGTLSLLRGAEHGFYSSQLTGPFGYPNAMAGSLLLAAGAAATRALDRHRPGLRFAALGSAGLLTALIWLTGSRGACLALGLGVLTWAICGVLSRLRRPGLVAGLAGLGVGAAVIATAWLRTLPLPMRWSSLLAPTTDSSILWRWHILRWTWDMISDHPWWGVGPGAFPVALTHYQRIPYVSGENPHNLLAQVAAEYGLAAAALLLVALGLLVGRMAWPVVRRSEERHAPWAEAAMFATFVAFLTHSLVDMAWSYPAVAVAAATLGGLGIATFSAAPSELPRPARGIRIGLGIALAMAIVLALTRFYASTLVEDGRQALAAGQSSLAIQNLTWALRLNPVSFPAHRWLAQARLRAGDPPGALAVAEQAARLAPADPNGAFLAGEIAAASGQWARADGWFRTAALRAPFAQLRFHAGAVEAAARTGDGSEARARYQQAIAVFSPERVVGSEARCLAPGDRYLLARMSRIAAGLYEAAGDQARRQEAETVARQLGQPDTRGICAVAGREGQASPEVAMASFWDGLGRGGWREAERFLAPTGRGAIPEPVWRRWARDTRETQSTVSWVASLSGNESQVTLTVELLAHDSSGQASRRCARASLRIMDGDWFLEELPQVFPGPCTP
jgi:putative inorganic carbon (hco3(-)) transporter